MSHFVLLSEAIGAGHERAAIALEESLLAYSPNIHVTRLNLLDTFRPVAAKVTRMLYLNTLARRPEWWGKWYEWQRDKEWKGFSRSLVYGILRKDIGKWLNQLMPDAVICTHPLPASLIADLKRKGLRIPIITVLTDFDLHGYWTHPDVDLYCVPLQSMADDLQERFQGKSQVHVTGIPISHQFDDEQRSICKEQRKKRLLIMGGGLGIGVLPIVERIMEAPRNFHVTVIAGKNDGLRQELLQLYAGRTDIRIIGYTQQMDRYMAESDLLITKPGGLTLSEALAMRLPMVLLTAIQGQEQRNGQVMAELGVAVTANTEQEAVALASEILNRDELREQMIDRMEKVRRPNSANEIVEIVMEYIEGGGSVADRSVYGYIRATS